MFKMLFTLIFAATLFGAGFWAGMKHASKPFQNARQILNASRLPANLNAAEIVSRVYQQMKPMSDKIKPAFAVMSLCKKEQTVRDLRAASIEVALQQITGNLQNEINRGALSTRESAVFAFSGAFTAWLFSVNDPDLIKTLDAELKAHGKKLTRDMCNREEKNTRLLIDELKFVSKN